MKRKPEEKIRNTSNVTRAGCEGIHELHKFAVLVNSQSRKGIGISNHGLGVTVMENVVPVTPESWRNKKGRERQETDAILPPATFQNAAVKEFVSEKSKTSVSPAHC